MAAKNPFRASLIAPCGMDCAICMAYLQEKNRCGGCYTPDRQCRRTCPIFTCEQVRDRYYHTCEEFPCRRLFAAGQTLSHKIRHEHARKPRSD